MLTTATMKRRPTTPGEMLLEEYLKPAGITQVALAAKMGVPIQRVNGIISGRRAVTAETAILLARALGTTPELWLNLQVAVDLWDARQRMPRRSGPSHSAREHRRAARRLSRHLTDRRRTLGGPGAPARMPAQAEAGAKGDRAGLEPQCQHAELLADDWPFSVAWR
jgi:addiction module HigA family antidote